MCRWRARLKCIQNLTLKRKSRKCCRNIVQITKLNVLSLGSPASIKIALTTLFAGAVLAFVMRGLPNIEKRIRTAQHAGKMGSNASSDAQFSIFFTKSKNVCDTCQSRWTLVWPSQPPRPLDCWIPLFHFQLLAAVKLCSVQDLITRHAMFCWRWRSSHQTLHRAYTSVDPRKRSALETRD